MSALYPSDQGSMLFALFLDAQLRNACCEKLRELLTLVVGGVPTVKFSSEIDLLGSLCYFVPGMVVNRATLGQSFCGMSLHEVVSVDGVDKLRPNASASKSPALSSKLVEINQNLVLAAFLQSFLPYIYSRRGALWSYITNTVDILVAPEIPGCAVSSNGDANIDRSCVADITVNEASKKRTPSIATIILNAFLRSVQSIASETEVRIERISNFFWEIHLCLFFIYGRYVEIPLRLTNLQPFTKGPPKIHIKLKALAWLLGFRLICFVYYATRVMCSEIDKELVKDSIEDSSPDGKTAAQDKHIGWISNNRMDLSCSVCLDIIQSPSTLPCGHICCWDCIMPYAILVKNRGSGGGDNANNDCRCPVCRNEFLPQEIRALHY